MCINVNKSLVYKLHLHAEARKWRANIYIQELTNLFAIEFSRLRNAYTKRNTTIVTWRVLKPTLTPQRMYLSFPTQQQQQQRLLQFTRRYANHILLRRSINIFPHHNTPHLIQCDLCKYDIKSGKSSSFS